MTTAKRIIKNTLSLFTSGLLAPLIAMAAVVYLARSLGPQDFGTINFAVALTTYFAVFTEMGLGLYGTREIARNRSALGDYLGSMLTLRAILSTIGFILLVIFVLFLNKSHEIKSMVIIFGLGLFSSAFLTEWAYQGVEHMEYIGFSRILTRGLFALLVILFVRRHDQLIFVPWFQVCTAAFVTAVFFWLFIRKFGAPRFHFDVTVWWRILKAAWPLGISIILIQAIYNLSTVMLGFIRGEEEVGYYNAAYKIIFPLIMGSAAYFDAIFPVVSNYYNTSLAKLKKMQEGTARFMTAVAVPFAVGGILAARPIVHLFYGELYEPSVRAFQILVCVAAINCVKMIYDRGLWACNREGVYLKIVFSQLCTIFVLNLFLIPKWGFVGASIGTLSSELVGLVFYRHKFNEIMRISFVQYIGRPLLAACAMAIFIMFTHKMHVGFILSGSAFIYVVSLFMVKGITKDDLAIVRRSFA